MKPVKLGIIGTGIAARELHWPALKELRDKFVIVIVCNHTEPKAKQFSELIGGVPYVLDYREMLKNPEIEAVDIILPIELNYPVTAEVMKAGKHILLEKPLAANLREAKKMVSLEKSFNKIAMVAENFRYRKVFQKASQMLEEGKIGDVFGIFWNSFNLVEPDNNIYAQTQWRIHHQYPGGFITDGGVHNIAALRDLFGDIIPTAAFTRSVNPAIGEIDSLSFQFKTGKGIQGVYNMFFSVKGYQDERQLIILGKKGSIIIGNGFISLTEEGKTEITDKFDGDDGYKGEFEDFYRAVRENQKPVSTFEKAYGDLKVLIDAYKLAGYL